MQLAQSSDNEDDYDESYKSDQNDSDEQNISTTMNESSRKKQNSHPSSTRNSSSRTSSRSSSSSSDSETEHNKKTTTDEDESLIASIHQHHKKEAEKNDYSEEDNDEDEDREEDSSAYQDDNEEFTFDLPFSDLSPMNNNKTLAKPTSITSKKNSLVESASNKLTTRSIIAGVSTDLNLTNSCSSDNTERSTSTSMEARSMQHNKKVSTKNNPRLQFRPEKTESDDDEEDELGIRFEYNRRNFNDVNEDSGSKSSENEEDLLKDFDVIEVIPGFGEAPKNNKEFDIKILKKTEGFTKPQFVIKEEHFKKPLTKVDVLRAPENYPVPLNVYCVQEVSINWCLYGGNDFLGDAADLNEVPITGSASQNQTTTTSVSNQQIANRINRAVSTPVIVGQQNVTRSRHNSTSSNSMSVSPQQFFTMQSPDKNNKG